MEGYTIAELAKLTGLNPHTVKGRLYRAGVKPKLYAGPTAIYDRSALDVVQAPHPMGRPKAKE